MATLIKLLQELQIAAKKAEIGTAATHLHLRQAMQNVTDALESPTEIIRRILFHPIQSLTLRLAVEMGLPKALAEQSPITVSELSRNTRCAENLIVRVMRVLVAMGICREQSQGVYAANLLTIELASPTFDGGARFLYDTVAPVGITKYMHAHGFNVPKVDSPFAQAFGEGLWSYLKTDPILLQYMMDYMKGRRKGSLRWVDVFPAATWLGPLSNGRNAVRIVDIGGNQGHDLKAFRETYPELNGRCIVMDLQPVIDRSKPIDGVEFKGYNMFSPQPIEGSPSLTLSSMSSNNLCRRAQIYLLRCILHDWPDELCQKILSNTAKAMKPGYSRILINEIIMPETGVELLPALLDMLALTTLAGLERTEKQWRALLESVGLEITNIWTRDGADPVIEAMIRDGRLHGVL